MTQMDHVSDALGYSVIAHKEGAQLGGVNHVFIDPETKRISGMTLKGKRPARESWFGAAEIELIGKDVILLKGEGSLIPLAKGGVTSGKSLKEMRGMPVVTLGGKQLGLLDDLEVRGADWSISELSLDNNRRLPVDSLEIRIGPDQIIVPVEYKDLVVTEDVDKPGFLSRVFNSD